MPTYEYRCKDCGQHLEVVQAFTDDALTECPACKGQLRKVFGNIGITFKGSGFYKTDSRAKKSASKSDSKSSDTTSETATSDSKSDSKSDTKSDSKSETKSETKKKDIPSTTSSTDAKTA
jgi:putative FmdB family regulatory protein